MNAEQVNIPVTDVHNPHDNLISVADAVESSEEKGKTYSKLKNIPRKNRFFQNVFKHFFPMFKR